MYNFGSQVNKKSMTEFIYWLGDIFTWTFKNILEPLGDFPNMLISIVGLAGFLYWMLLIQPKFNKKAKDSGGLA